MRQARRQLAQLNDPPELDAEILLAHTLNKPRSYLFAWPEKEITDSQVSVFQGLLSRRCNGEPIAYILRRREFWSMELEVDQHTLIPRPETELLVETALPHITPDTAVRIADLGTGSGAIALAIASERPQAHIVATDIDTAALQIARSNAQRHHLTNVSFCRADWGQALAWQSFDMIVSNPPYVASDSIYLQQGDVRFEPRHALVAADNGLSDLQIIIEQALLLLKPAGWLLLEHGYDQGDAVLRFAHLQGYVRIENINDINGLSRVLAAQKPSKA